MLPSMERNPCQRRLSGFALIEALVALLLLAVAVVGAVRAMVESLAGQHGVLLRVQAADLAGDLAEALRSAPDDATAAAEIRSWQSTVARRLPAGEGRILAGAAPNAFSIRLNWRDGRAPAPASLSLPLNLDDSPVPP